VHRFDLGDQAAAVAQLPDEGELKGAHHGAVELGDKDVVLGIGVDAFERSILSIDQGDVRGGFVGQLVVTEETHDRRQITPFSRPNRHRGVGHPKSLAQARAGHLQFSAPLVGRSRAA
jgi:hypothetical protein